MGIRVIYNAANIQGDGSNNHTANILMTKHLYNKLEHSMKKDVNNTWLR